jgi:hypothetical protein
MIYAAKRSLKWQWYLRGGLAKLVSRLVGLTIASRVLSSTPRESELLHYKV